MIITEENFAEQLLSALRQRRSYFGDTATTLFFDSDAGRDMVAYVKTRTPLGEIDRRLLQVFCSNIARSFENVVLFSKIKDQAYLDQTLKIPNRLAFVQAIDVAMAKDRENHSLAVVDIDYFSGINNALGHRYGDALLKMVASRLQTEFPGINILARIGSDAFGLLGLDSEISPTALQQLFDEPFIVEGTGQHISASLGLVRLAQVDGAGNDALKAANIALNQAKRGDRGKYSYFAPEMETEAFNRLQRLRDLRAAFDSNRLYLVYQPQLSLVTREVIGVEALLRWRTEDGLFIPPDQFIPLAESSGLILPLGTWVLKTACQAQRRFSGALQAGALRMAVNVSVTQFRQPNFIQTVDAIIEETGIQPEQLELEITESVAMLDPGFMVNMINSLKERKITLAVDDFGTGFSSLSYLEKLRVDRLKIDRSFVGNIASKASSRRIVETIVGLGQALNLCVIAEGVEYEEQAQILAGMHCHEAQGYLFSRPLEEAQLLAFLADAADAKPPV